MSDTKEILTCPACDKIMTKIYVKDANMNVDICLDGCGGILFDNKELEKVDEKHENADEIFDAKLNKSFEPVDQREVRLCSVCNHAMIKQGTGIVEIDVCANCGAVFLDHNELKKIRQFKGSDTEQRYKEKIDILVNKIVDKNEVNVGGKIGDFAKKHVKTTVVYKSFLKLVEKIIDKY